jgi:CubicO group peptidase (beta-lactamase class C family)
MTKALVSTGALLLVEQGKLSLDGKVSAYLPYWDDDKVTVAVEGEAPIAAERAITIRMLCCHASGIGSPASVGWSPYTGQAPTAKTLKEFVEVVLATPLRHQPGQVFEYAMSTDFLGAVIEEVSGQRLGVFLKENLFDPLGMPDTSFEIPEAKLDRFCEMHRGTGLAKYELAAHPLCLSDMGTTWLEGKVHGHGGGGGILSTAIDYMRFTQWLASGCLSLDGEAKSLISPRLVKEMQIDQLAAVGAARGPCFDPYQGFCAIGGVVVSPGLPGDYFPAGTGSGAGSIGWGGIAGTSFVADPENELCIVLYTQVFDYYLCSPNLRKSFQHAVYGCFPDIKKKMDTKADNIAGQEGNMVYLPVY